ncbi:MAG: DMT family transporter [Pseudomonadota bacterium]
MSLAVREDAGSRTSLGVPLLAMGLMFAALSGALMKLMAAELNPVQITWGRYVGYFLCVAPIALWRFRARVFNPPHIVAQVMRSVMILATTLLFTYAVKVLPLAEAIAIIYVYPFIVALLSPWMLAERVPGIAWFGCAAGFAGVLLVMRPDGEGTGVASLLAVAAGVLYALHLLFTRMVAASISALVSTTFLPLVAIVLLTPTAFVMWEPMSLRQIAYLGAMGAVNAIAHLFIILAYSRATASGLAPFSYIEIVAALVWGLLIFGDVPDTVSIAGIAVIIISGVLVAQGEKLGKLFSRKRGATG